MYVFNLFVASNFLFAINYWRKRVLNWYKARKHYDRIINLNGLNNEENVIEFQFGYNSN